MRKMLIAVAAAVLAAMPAAASEKADVMAVVHQVLDGFNKGDVNSFQAACAESTSIIDEFAPYEWHGAGACSKWTNDFEADAKKNGISDGAVAMGEPSHVDITGDLAYVVAPATYTYKQHGKPMKESGSRFVVVLQKAPSGWRITGWAWAKH
jgi:ketosteroid isomerase-like protein